MMSGRLRDQRGFGPLARAHTTALISLAPETGRRCFYFVDNSPPMSGWTLSAAADPADALN